jgi:hypothetical protein
VSYGHIQLCMTTVDYSQHARCTRVINFKMAAETGSSYKSGTELDSSEILKTTPIFSDTPDSLQLVPTFSEVFLHPLSPGNGNGGQ